MTTSSPVPAVHAWPTNAHLIADVARLGWLQDTPTLDATWGHGTFWKIWQPTEIVGHDLNPNKAPNGGADFTHLPYPDRTFPQVVFDPPYKLNGTPDDNVDERYGVDQPASWQERMALIKAGTTECARVSSKALLVKVQDQVASGKVRWQTRLVTDTAEQAGFRLADRFDMVGHHRPQPADRRQVHAHGRPSSLLVFIRTTRAGR